MAVDTTITLSQEILEKIENEEVLTQEDLKELLVFRAALMGLDFDEAYRQSREGTLPGIDGSDFRLLASMLDQELAP